MVLLTRLLISVQWLQTNNHIKGEFLRVSGAVCEHCSVVCNLYYDNGGVYINCPICGNGDPELTIEESGLSDQQLESNLIFLAAIKGIELNGSGTTSL